MEQEFKVFRETILPGVLTPYALYVVAPASKPGYLELYGTNSTGTEVRRIIDEARVQQLIDSALISSMGQFPVFNNITARDAEVFTQNTKVFVIDASDDPTVDSGGATYLWLNSSQEWIKLSEEESLDLEIILNWDDIVGRPSSTPAQIDAAVANSHTHSNKSELDKIGEDSNGNLTYNGELPKIAWASTGW